jgi:tetratricopeptide (TPR) repeat protein
MKKRIVTALLVLALLCLAGCKSGDYDKALALYEEGTYEEAYAAFTELGDYEDSQAYIENIITISNEEFEKWFGLERYGAKGVNLYLTDYYKENATGSKMKPTLCVDGTVYELLSHSVHFNYDEEVSHYELTFDVVNAVNDDYDYFAVELTLEDGETIALKYTPL